MVRKERTTNAQRTQTNANTNGVSVLQHSSNPLFPLFLLCFLCFLLFLSSNLPAAALLRQGSHRSWSQTSKATNRRIGWNSRHRSGRCLPFPWNLKSTTSPPPVNHPQNDCCPRSTLKISKIEKNVSIDHTRPCIQPYNKNTKRPVRIHSTVNVIRTCIFIWRYWKLHNEYHQHVQ